MKKLSIVIILTCLFVISAQSPSNAAKSSKPPTIDLGYDIYAGGLRVFSANLEMFFGASKYEINLDAATQGFIGSLFPWKSTYKTSGVKKNGALVPSSYKKVDTWRDESKTTTINYGKNGEVLSHTEEENGKTKEEKNINKILSGNAADVLTGTITMLQSVKGGKKCQGKFPVFDGKRRFNIVMHDEGKEVIKPSEYSIFSGETTKCTLKVEPVAGFKEKDKKRGWMAVQEHTEERKKLPTLWLAKVPNSQQIIPVKMEIASSYGSVIAHLIKENIKR